MHHRIRPVRTALVALSTAALGVGVLAAPPASAEPSPALRAAKAAAPSTDSTPSTIAAEWIAGELRDGLIVGSSGPDFGLTIDTGMALSTVASQSGTVTAINNSLEPRIADYVGDGTKESYAGPLAKAATFARVAKKNPTSYGGINLITRLEERTADATTGPAPNTQAEPARRPGLRQVGVRRLRQRGRSVLRRACADAGELRRGRCGARLPAQAAVRVGLLPR